MGVGDNQDPIGNYPLSFRLRVLAGRSPVGSRVQHPGDRDRERRGRNRISGRLSLGVPKVTDGNEHANDLVQSHEIEFQMGINDWFRGHTALVSCGPSTADYIQ